MHGYGVVTDLFRRIQSNRLQGFVVFVPMWPGDSEEEANSRAGGGHDGRITYWWDEGRASVHPFAAVLGLRGPAWDVYMVYAAGTAWKGEAPPRPGFWMHQLSAERTNHPENRLDERRLESVLEGLLRAADSGEGSELEVGDVDR